MKKKIFIMALMVIVSVVTFAQSINVKGTIKGRLDNPVIVSYDRVRDTVKISDDGTFSLKIDTEKDEIDVRLLGIGNNAIIMVIANGEVVNLVADITNPENESIEFSGYNAALNDYLTTSNALQHYSLWTEERMVNRGSFFAHKAAVDNMITILQNKIDKIEDSGKKVEIQKHINIIQHLFYFNYIWALARLKNCPIDDDKDFVKYIESINVNDRRILDEPWSQKVSYSNILGQRFRWEVVRDTVLYNGKNSSINIYMAINKLVDDQDVAKKLATDNFEMYMLTGGDNYPTETFTAYKGIINDSKITDKFEQKVKDLNELLPGKMAPDFVLVDTEGNKSMLSDLRGKNIYIDIWATWCVPCVAEIPYVERLHKKYKDSKNIEFVSISVDDRINDWKRKLQEDKPEWKNFVVEGGFNGPTRQLYHISGVPRFILIDKEGKIVSVDAPRPSSADIEKYLAPYL